LNPVVICGPIRSPSFLAAPLTPHVGTLRELIDVANAQRLVPPQSKGAWPMVFSANATRERAGAVKK
jgi:hypothetical protein